MAAILNEVSKETIRSRVYSELRRALMSGLLEPGEPIVVRTVAEKMNVGTMPVRESIQQLVAEGGLEFLPNRTVRVPVLDADDLREIFEIRMAVEGMATALAAKRIGSSQLERLELLLELAMRPKSKIDPADAQLADFSFHFAIYDSAEARHLVHIIEQLWIKVGPLHIAPFKMATDRDSQFFQSFDQHKELIDALRRHDAKSAKSKMERIIKHSLDWHLQFSVPSTAAD